MESERLAASDRTLVPNRYTVHLNPDDVAAFGEFGSTLAAELADDALVFARAHHYTLVDRPRVELVSDPAIDRADIVVRARFADPIVERAAEPQRPAGPNRRRTRKTLPTTRWCSRSRDPRRRAPACA